MSAIIRVRYYYYAAVIIESKEVLLVTTNCWDDWVFFPCFRGFVVSIPTAVIIYRAV